MNRERTEGGVTGGVEELYREVILDHFKSPKNRGPLPAANARAEGVNPLCGDQIAISAIVEGGKVRDVKFEGHGCAISQSAASMITELVKGRSVEEAQDLTAAYKRMFGVDESGGGQSDRFQTDDLGDLVALEGVKKYPVRIKCALLSANTFLEGLRNFFKNKGA